MSTQWPFLQFAGSSHSFTSEEQQRFSPEDISLQVSSSHSPVIVASTHFFLLLSGIHGWLQLQKKDPSVLTQWPLVHRDSSWHSFTSEGAERSWLKTPSDNIRNILKTNFELCFFGGFGGEGRFRTHQCTPAGCCRSRSPFRSSIHNRAVCSHSDLSCRSPQRTENTRQCLQTRKEQRC